MMGSLVCQATKKRMPERRQSRTCRTRHSVRLGLIVNIDSGKLSFICYQKADENPEMLFARPPGDKKSGSLPTWTSKTPMWSDAAFTTQPKSRQGITFFAIPSVDVKAHYSSQQAGERTAVAQSARTTSPPSSPLHPRQDPGQQKRGLMYVWAQMKSPEDEIVVTTSILDFLEQALKVIPPAVDTADATSPTESQPSHPKEDETDIDASTNSLVSSSAVDYTTFPVDVIVYFLVQPSVIHLTCLPSRVECLLQLPCTELSFHPQNLWTTVRTMSERGETYYERFTSPNRRRQFSGDDSMDARKSANSGLHCSIVLSNFSLVVFHPYGEQFRKDLSQKFYVIMGKATAATTLRENANIIMINIFNYVIMGKATAATTLRCLRRACKPQVAASMSRNALSLEVNLVKVNISRQRSREFPNIAGVSFFHGSPAGAPMSPARTIINQFSDDELSSSSTSSSSDTEDSFSRLPSRHVKRRCLSKGTSSNKPLLLRVIGVRGSKRNRLVVMMKILPLQTSQWARERPNYHPEEKGYVSILCDSYIRQIHKTSVVRY
ncbi:hypothetical protein BSL78_20839 [Apostichopus japonicus]|uniref:Bridge-like lipid transfer protein family member 1 C-terminal domain-containing protein n=1 Tax=Stichopus japonicus TaxID=307972 RepID=A0A2G8K2Y2_STIJA|nr:hypothetical protein BSL78_20839 [Apostichopus japonicus]